MQKYFALKGEDERHRQAYMLQQQTAAAANPTQGIHPMDEGNVGPQWGAFFDSLQREGASIGARRGTDPMPGLRTDMQSIREVPSLDGLDMTDPREARRQELIQRDRQNATNTAYALPAKRGF